MIEKRTETAAQCATCRYCQKAGPAGPIVGQSEAYECRRNPPIAVPVGGPGGQIGMAAMFPPVKLALWCGEYQPKGSQQ